MIKVLLSSVGLIALASTAAAQDVPAAPPNPEQSQDQGRIEDIVVTASRRAENVQRAALSIQALTSETLARANVSRPEDLASIAPGVQIGSAGPYAQAYVRGVGNYATNSFAESPIAFNLDGVYISRAWATRGMFYDLDRVEVLKGPQGTLYGRNASGGAINVITAKPKLGSVSGFIEGQVGNYNLWQGTAAVNLPIGETVAIRASGQVIDRDGYLSDGYDDD
jgi:iron complex outermembrane receptor protein